jgi:tetratricopeptide (TPR) repeat protein
VQPKSAHAFRNRGVVYAFKGDNEKAIADLDEAIRLDPKSALTYRNRGDAYLNKGEYERAIADYSEAIRLDPGNAFAFCNRGGVKRKIRDASGSADIARARQLDASACRCSERTRFGRDTPMPVAHWPYESHSTVALSSALYRWLTIWMQLRFDATQLALSN